MPSNLSADERAAVEWVTKNVVEAVEEGARFPLNDDDARHLRTLLAVVARAGEAVDYGHLAHCNASRSAPIGPNRSCVCWNLMQDGIAHRTAAQTGEAVAWGIWHYNGDLVGLKRTKDEAERWCEGSATYGPPRPLYAHPADARDRGDASEALRPFAHLWHQWSRMPMRGCGDEFYAIHIGTEYEASLRRSDCERAAKVRAAIDHAMHAAPAAPEEK